MTIDKPEMIEKSTGLGPLKLTCPTCGYTLRIAEKWLQTIGAPDCPMHGTMTIHWPMEPRSVVRARFENALNEAPRPKRARCKKKIPKASIILFPGPYSSTAPRPPPRHPDGNSGDHEI